MPHFYSADKEPVVKVEIKGRVQRIGVVSDTHVPSRAHCLPPELLKGLEGWI